MDAQPRRRRTVLAASVVAAALAIGAGAGATAVALTGHTKTIVRQVTVPDGSGALASNAVPSVATVAKQASRGVVEITVSGSGGSGEGSGFVYDKQGRIVTNAHVVEGASSITVVFQDGTRAKAELVGSDPSTDVAVVKVDVAASRLHPLTLGDSSALQVGDEVIAIGSPFGLAQTVTSGIVSALDREIQAPDGTPIEGAIQTDAAINHGNSGGPLVDLAGKVVGITSQINSESQGNDGIGFAVPSTTVRSVVTQLLASGTVRHGFLGVSVDTVSKGVRITGVEPGSGAASAHLRTGDVITALDGKQVKTSERLRAAISEKKPGDRIELTVLRDGKTRTVSATLGRRPS